MKTKKIFILLFLMGVLVTVLCNLKIEDDLTVDTEEIMIAAGGTTTVNSWNELTTAVESGSYSVINLKSLNGDWSAFKVLTIDRSIKLVVDSSNTGPIIINREIPGYYFDVKNGATLEIDASSKGITFNGSYSTTTKPFIGVSGGATVKIINASLKNNKSNINGGAINVEQGTLILENCSMGSNEAAFGGAIYVADSNSKLTVNGGEYFNNKTNTGSGGAIYAYGTVSITEANIHNNTAATYGGGLMLKKTATITNTKVNNNTATANAGGGIRVDGSATVTGGEVKNNKANEGGGGIDFYYGDSFKKTNVTLSGNMVGTTEVNIYPDLDSPNNIDWKKDSSIKLEEIPFQLLKSFKKDGTGDLAPHTGATQGLTMTDKFILLVQWESNEEPTKIHVLDKNTLARKNTIVFDTTNPGYTLGHANDMAYDKKTGFVYVYSGHKVNDKVQLVKFKVNNNGQMTDLSTIDAPRGISGLAIDNDHDQFIVYSGGKMYIYDKDFKEKKNFSAPTNLTTQGIGYWKGYIYFACYEAGVPTIYQTKFNYNERQSNLIYMYDLDGNLVKTLYLSNKIAKGELESVEFYDNGDMLFNYNYEGISLFKSNYTTQIKKVEIGELPHKVKYIQNKENIDLEGLVLGVTLNNEVKSQITSLSDVTVSGFDNSVLGVQTVTLTYRGVSIPLEIEIVKETIINPGTGGVGLKTLLLIIVLGISGWFISNKFRKLYKV